MTRFEHANRLRAAFRACFGRGAWRTEDGDLTEHAKLTLDTMRQFCYADRPCFDHDDRQHCLNEGRRETWLEIRRILNISDATLDQLREPNEAEE